MILSNLEGTYSGYKIGLAIVLAAFLAIYIPILLISDFLPYVMDNNESFSVLWHSYNLYNFEFFKSYGLADDSNSYSAQAHPFAHTHQGNFPRIFGFLIFVLGARTVELQITITLFVVVLPSIIIAYNFLSRISSPMLATVTCLVLLTDYVNFTQWQVVTYRVWHTLFFFLTLALVRAYADRERRSILIAAVVTGASLFYFEISFALFIAVTTALYALVILRKQPKSIMALGSAFALGGLVAGVILISQLILYLGWDGFQQDLAITYNARNNFGSDDYANYMQEIKKFYAEHDVAFWFNMYDASKGRSIFMVIRNIINDFNPHTPIFTVISLAIFLAWPFRRLGDVAFKLHGLSVRHGAFWAIAALISMPVLLFLAARYSYLWGSSEHIIVASGIVILLGIAVSGLKFGDKLGHLTSWLYSKVAAYLQQHATTANQLAWAVSIIMLASMPALSAYLNVGLSGMATITILILLSLWLFVFALNVEKAMAFARAVRTRPLHALFLVIFAFSAMIFFHLSSEINIFTASRIGRTRGQSILPVLSLSFAILLVIGVSFAARGRFLTLKTILNVSDKRWFAASGYLLLLAFIISNQRLLFNYRYAPIWENLSMGWNVPVLGRFMFLLAVLFGCAYIIAPRAFEIRLKSPLSETFIVFLVSAVGFLAAYMVFTGYILTGYIWRNVPFTIFFTSLIISIPVVMLISAAKRYRQERRNLFANVRMAAAVLLVLFIGSFWASTQYRWAKMLPADGAGFLAQLREEPFKGKSFVGMGYMAPIAAMTGKWAYYEPRAELGRIIEKNGAFEPDYSYDYLWFADRDTNDEYKKPDYFLCFLPTNRLILSNMMSGDCLSRGLFAGNFPDVRSPGYDHTNFNWELVSYDEEGKRANGQARWAIMRLDWRTPPTLENEHIKVSIAASQAPEGVWIKPEYRYFQPDGDQETGTEIRTFSLGVVKKAEKSLIKVARLGGGKARVTFSPQITGSKFKVELKVGGGDYAHIATLNAGHLSGWITQFLPRDDILKFRLTTCDGEACKTYYSNIVPPYDLDLSCFGDISALRQTTFSRDDLLLIKNPAKEGIIVSVRPVSSKKPGRTYYSAPFIIDADSGVMRKVSC